jgi:hypothetical protein
MRDIIECILPFPTRSFCRGRAGTLGGSILELFELLLYLTDKISRTVYLGTGPFFVPVYSSRICLFQKTLLKKNDEWSRFG